MHTSTHARSHARTHTRTHARTQTHTHIHTRTHARTHARTHTNCTHCIEATVLGRFLDIVATKGPRGFRAFLYVLEYEYPHVYWHVANEKPRDAPNGNYNSVYRKSDCGPLLHTLGFTRSFICIFVITKYPAYVIRLILMPLWRHLA